MNDETILSEFNEGYQTAQAYWSSFLETQKANLKFYLGDQWSSTDKAYLKAQRRNALVFNKVHRLIKLISGYQRKNRLAFKVDAVEGSDEATANQLSAALMWVVQNTDGYHIMSDAFAGALTTSINLVNIYQDFSQDPVSGDIRFKRIPYNRFLLDPNFSERDLSDCDFMMRREYLPKPAVQMLLPDFAKDIEEMSPKGSDGKYTQFTPPQDLRGGKLMRYDEFLVRDFKPVKTLFNTETKEQFTFEGEAEELREIKQKYPNILIVDGFVKTVELRIIVDDHVMYQGPEPLGIDDFGYVPIMGFWTPEYHEAKWKLRSLVNLVRDAAEEVNRRKSKMLDIIDSVIASGFKVEENSLVDDKAPYGAGQGQVIWAKEGKLDRIQELQGRDIPQGLFQLNQQMEQDIMEIAGANSELFGTPSNDADVPALLAKMRQSAGLTGQQDLFDNYRLAKKFIGRKTVKAIQKNYTPSKIERIIGEKPTEEVYKQDFGKYDCVMVEGILSDTQKQMAFAQLLEFKKAGMPIPDTLILAQSNIENKKAIKETMEAEAKAAQAAQAEEAEDKKLMTGLMQAKQAEDLAQAGERRTQSVENEENAILNKVKALKELQQLDVTKIKESLKIVESIAKLSGIKDQKGVEKPTLIRR